MATSEVVMRCQRRKKEKAVEYLGGKCSICGYDRCLAALDFHHTDPSIKEQRATYIISRWAWERVKAEIDKCILVCSNCHREIHYGMHTVENLRSCIRPTLQKTCNQCLRGFETRSASQQLCSRTCSALSQRKVERPSKEQLHQDVQNMPLVAVGNKYGVSDNAVRKWLKAS